MRCPGFAGLHTPDEDRWFYREHVLATCRVWGRFDADVLSGIIAVRDGWVEQLYVLPAVQGRSVGTELLDIAKRASEQLELWTFQRNALAGRFYEARGFTLIEQTNGTRNEEKEPDARYLWTRGR